MAFANRDTVLVKVQRNLRGSKITPEVWEGNKLEDSFGTPPALGKVIHPISWAAYMSL